MSERIFAFLQVSKAWQLAELAISAGSLIIC